MSRRSSDYLLVSIRIRHLMLIRARNGTAYTEVEYDPTEGVEVLNSQLASLFSDAADDANFLIVDYAGKRNLQDCMTQLCPVSSYFNRG